MTDFTRSIVDLEPKATLEFKLSSRQTIISKFEKLTSHGAVYRNDEAIEYLEIRSNQQITPIEFIKQGQSVSLQLGQYLTTVNKLTLTFNWTQKKVRYWLARWQKQGIVSCQTVKNKFGHTIGTLVTLNKFQEFRNQLEIQFKIYSNKKKLSQNWGSRFLSNNQEKRENGANKLINKETYKNNKENEQGNSLIFEANKKLFEFNAKILEEKRKQEEELINLRISLKKEKTQNKQLKALKKFEVTGKIETKSIQFNWDFQKTVEYKQIAEKLKAFGFEQYAINKLWWKNSQDIQRLIDFIDYTQMKYEQGKVNDPKKFLYHALLASYDLGELERMRCDAKSREEKDRIENDKMMEDIRLRQEHEKAKELQQRQDFEEFGKITNWIQNNQSHTIYDDIIIKLQAENKFLHDLFCKKARRSSIFGVANYLKSVKSSKMDLCVSGLYTRVKAIMKVSVMA